MKIKNNNELNFTGERLTTSMESGIMVEHLHRYAIAETYTKNKIVLDIACGEGYGSMLLSKKAKSVIGVDISVEAISHSQNKYKAPNLTFKVGSASNIPLPDKSIDVIVSFETIEHHDQHEKMLDEIKRILKDNGVLIISSPDKLYYSDIPKYNNPFHIKELYEKEFRELINKHFKHIFFLSQRCLSGSIIISETNSDNLIQFSGDYLGYENQGNFKPLYNIAIASDKNLEDISSSIFESDKYYENLSGKSLIDLYTNSTTWKIGRLVLYPYNLMKRILNK